MHISTSGWKHSPTAGFKCLHLPPCCSHKALPADKFGETCQTGECLQSFLPRANSVYKFAALQNSLEIAVFMFRVTLSVRKWRKPNELADLCWGFLGHHGNQPGLKQQRIRRRFNFGLCCLGWKSEEENKRWMWRVSLVCLCSDRCRSAKDRGACGSKWDWLQLRRGNKVSTGPRRKHRHLIKDCGGKKNSRNKRIYLHFHLLVSHGKLA